jgi:hypothetical protein
VCILAHQKSVVVVQAFSPTRLLHHHQHQQQQQPSTASSSSWMVLAASPTSSSSSVEEQEQEPDEVAALFAAAAKARQDADRLTRVRCGCWLFLLFHVTFFEKPSERASKQQQVAVLLARDFILSHKTLSLSLAHLSSNSRIVSSLSFSFLRKTISGTRPKHGYYYYCYSKRIIGIILNSSYIQRTQKESRPSPSPATGTAG